LTFYTWILIKTEAKIAYSLGLIIKLQPIKRAVQKILNYKICFFVPRLTHLLQQFTRHFAKGKGLELLLAVYKEMLQWVIFYTDFGCGGCTV